MHRHMANKTITYNLEDWEFSNERVYNTILALNDTNSLTRLKKSYWWLTADAKNLDDLRRRAKHKNLPR